MVTTYRYTAGVILLTLLCSLSESSQAAINVYVDRQQVGIGESFQMIFETDEKLDDPDFTPLQKDFKVFSNSQSSSTTISNGSIKSSKKWTLGVFAKRPGKLPIPAIKFGAKESPRSMIEIKATKQAGPQHGNDDIFLEAIAMPQQPYVQQQILFTVRLFHTISLSNGNLEEPRLSGVNAVLKKIGNDKQYQDQRGNRSYNVYQRSYAIFPQASGELTIEPIVFQGYVGSQANIFNRGNNPSQIVAKHTEAITLKVKKIPNNYQGQQWLVAKKINLTETWHDQPTTGKPIFQVGKPITRTIVLHAEEVTASQLPELQTKINDDFKQYPDQPALKDQFTDHGINGIRTKSIAIIPVKAGHYTLPEIRLPWWNTTTDKQDYAHLPAKTIEVLPAKKLPSANTATAQTDGTQGPGGEQSGNQAIPLISDPIGSGQADPGHWMILSILLGIAWLITAGLCVFLYLRPAKKNTTTEQGQRQGSLPDIMKALRIACEKNDPEMARDQLLRWDNHHHPDAPAGAIGKRYGDELEIEIKIMNARLYGGQKQQWSGQKLWDAIQALEKPTTAEKNDPAGLEPLHRL